MKTLKKIPPRFLFSVIIVLIVFSSFSWYKKAMDTMEKGVTIVFKNVVVKASIADTEDLREKGLSGRVTLPDGEGMWFVYQKNGLYSYWMPEMHFPIDIVWFDENLHVVYLQENATPESYPHVFTPNVLSRYVLEVPGGFVQKNGIVLGDGVSAQTNH